MACTPLPFTGMPNVKVGDGFWINLAMSLSDKLPAVFGAYEAVCLTTLVCCTEE
jgi:hypothetical protein